MNWRVNRKRDKDEDKQTGEVGEGEIEAEGTSTFADALRSMTVVYNLQRQRS